MGHSDSVLLLEVLGFGVAGLAADAVFVAVVEAVVAALCVAAGLSIVVVAQDTVGEAFAAAVGLATEVEGEMLYKLPDRPGHSS